MDMLITLIAVVPMTNIIKLYSLCAVYYKLYLEQLFFKSKQTNQGTQHDPIYVEGRKEERKKIQHPLPNVSGNSL